MFDIRHRSPYSTLFLFALLTLLPFLAGPVEAQPLQQGDFELGFGVGITQLDDSLTDEDADYRTEIRGGYFLTDSFELELEAARATGVLETNLDTVFLNAVFNFGPVGRAVPYLLAGAGAARLEDIELFSDDDVEETGAAYQVALGTRFFFGEDSRAAARFEVSNILEQTLDDTNSHLSVTAGLLWRIGR